MKSYFSRLNYKSGLKSNVSNRDQLFKKQILISTQWGKLFDQKVSFIFLCDKFTIDCFQCKIFALLFWYISLQIQIHIIFVYKLHQIMAQQMIQQDINIEEVLKMNCTVEGAIQYLVLNAEGIPIKKSSNITNERALHIAFLIQDYWSTAKKVVQSDLKMSDNPIKKIRMRTTKQQEIIIVQSFHGQATLYLVQDCNRKKEEPVKQVIKPPQ